MGQVAIVNPARNPRHQRGVADGGRRSTCQRPSLRRPSTWGASIGPYMERTSATHFPRLDIPVRTVEEMAADYEGMPRRAPGVGRGETATWAPASDQRLGGRGSAAVIPSAFIPFPPLSIPGKGEAAIAEARRAVKGAGHEGLQCSSRRAAMGLRALRTSGSRPLWEEILRAGACPCLFPRRHHRYGRGGRPEGRASSWTTCGPSISTPVAARVPRPSRSSARIRHSPGSWR